MTEEETTKPLRKNLTGKKTNNKERIRNTDPYLASARVLQNHLIVLRQEVRVLISLLQEVAKASSLPTEGLTALAEEMDSDGQ
jgi:hypothetical protein